MSKIVIIGSNHGGTAAVNTILGEYLDNEVVIFEKNSNISFLGCGMALWIGNQISGAEGLFYADKEGLEEAGATVNMESEVTDLDFDKKLVHARLADGSKVEETYDKLILATGSLPIIPNIPGRELENVQQVKLYQDAQEVIRKLADDEIENVTVVGAGYIGVELAEAFERHGKKVTMIDVEDTCLAGYYDEEFSHEMTKNLEDKGINLAYGEMVKEIQGDGRVERVITDKNEYDSDMVILSVGFHPNVALADGKVDQFDNGAYIVDKHHMTSQEDVYAIGDCSTVYDNAMEDISYIALATNAVRGGIIAAHNACGTELDAIGVQGSNGISIYDLNMVSTGLSYKRAKDLGFNAAHTDYKDIQKAGFMETDNPEVKIRIVYDKDDRRILGAQMASEYDMSMGIHMFSLAIQEKVTIEKLSLLDIFFLPHFNQPYNYITMAALGAE